MAQKLSNLPTRALIKFGKHQIKTETAQPIIWTVADKNHSGYPSNSVTLITEKIIDIRPYDAKESIYGNPDYKLSNISQWMNSDASAGKWYTASHVYDVAPSTGKNAYSARPGFLYNFTAAERQALLPVTLTVQTDDYNASQTMTTKVFLPSRKEVFGDSDFADGSSRLACFSAGKTGAYVTAQVLANVDSGSVSSTDEFYAYYTRTIYEEDIFTVTGDMDISRTTPYSTYTGIRPMINVTGDLKISDTTDADGCYTVLPQSIPVISGSNSNLGTKSAAFSRTYSVTDADNEAVTITEYIDDVKIRSYAATLGKTNTFAVTGNTWLKLANGSHTLKITATDGFDTATRVFTFTKSVTKLVVQRSTPLSASTRPSRIIITLVKNIPKDAIVKVEVCNNGYDASPVWETVENYDAGYSYAFTNYDKVESMWGVNIRVTVDRNGAEGACYITEIGGNFE
jgi:hypothetical protein